VTTRPLVRTLREYDPRSWVEDDSDQLDLAPAPSLSASTLDWRTAKAVGVAQSQARAH
jgi:hypothetical protein